MAGETVREASTRIVVVGHTLFRVGLREVLRTEEGFALVGEAGDHAKASSSVAETQPDVVLLDGGLMSFPDGDVAAAAGAILRAAPAARGIVVDVPDRPFAVHALLASGVRGYLFASVTRDDLVAAVRSVTADGERVVLSVSRASFAQPHEPEALPHPFSAREREVMALVARGLTNAQTARRLHIAEGTVRHHLRNIFTKLGTSSRVETVNKAITLGLVDPPSTRPPLRGTA